MTRLEEALKWWKKNTEPDRWIPHKDIPNRHLRTLRKAGLIKYEYKLFWRKGVPKDRGFDVPPKDL